VKHLPKVFIVDEDSAVLDSIRSLLAAQSYDVTCFASAEEFIAQHSPGQDDCVVVDLSSRGVGGSDLMRHLQETRSLLSVLIMARLIDEVVPHAAETRPVPMLAKPFEVWALLQMIEDAIGNDVKRDRALVHIVSNHVDWLHHYGSHVPAKDKISKLSPRQREVMTFLLAGDSLKEVAQKLGLSEHTIGDHVKQIYKHFSVSSRAELLAHFIPGGQQ
jgi:FixJ family two-component response regulator